MQHTVSEGRRRGGLLAEMDHEWSLIVAGHSGRRAWRRWHPQLRAAGLDLASLDELVAVIRHPGDHRRSDVVARILLAAAQAGDDLAARALMQGLVPFVGRLSGLYARYSTTVPVDDIVAEVLAALQLRIMRTNLSERDRLLVAYLQLTVRRQLGRGDSRRLLRPRPEVAVELLDLAEEPDTDRIHGSGVATSGPRSAADHVASIVTTAVRRGVLTLEDAELLLLAAAGNSAAAIARRLQRDRSVICRRLQRATRAAGRVAA